MRHTNEERNSITRKHLKTRLTKDDTERVLATIDHHPDGAFLAVLYYLGLRRGEALGLKWEDFDWNENQVHIRRSISFSDSAPCVDELKARAANRFIPVPKGLAAILYPHRESPDRYLFHDSCGSPLSQGTYRQMWERIRAASRLPAPRILRSNYIILLHESGIGPKTVMELTGCAYSQTNASIYLHAGEKHTRPE